MSGDNACPCFGCQCEPNQVTKDAIEEARKMNGKTLSHDKLLARIEEQAVNRAKSLADYEAGLLTRTSERAIARQMAKINWMKRQLSAWNALRAVVELIQEKQKFLEETKGDIPMTSQQLGAREERTKLLAEIKQAIEKELK